MTAIFDIFSQSLSIIIVKIYNIIYAQEYNNAILLNRDVAMETLLK